MSGQDSASARHYHLDDYPEALKVLAAVAAGRDLTEIGYAPHEFGAEVDWDALASSWLSTTERAAVHIARGVALAERAGGLPPHIAPAVLSAAGDITLTGAEMKELADRIVVLPRPGDLS